MLTNLVSFFKIEQLNERSIEVVSKFLLLGTLIALFQAFSSTFLVLYFLDIVGFSQVGIIFLLYFLISAITDYPTGVLADWIGHRYVLAVAHLLFSAFYLLLLIVTDFRGLLLIIILYSLANGQLSGALNSWFDNRYKETSGDKDSNREIYREFMGQYQMVTQLSSALAFVIGGVLATFVPSGRQFVFLIQGIGMLAILLLILQKVDPLERDEAENYTEKLKDGIKILFDNPALGYYALGSIIQLGVLTAWGAIIVFPLYFGYTGSDAGAGTLRFLIFLLGGLLIGFAGSLAKKLGSMQWISRFKVLDYGLFYGMSAIVVFFYPLMNRFQLLPLLMLLFAFVVTTFFYSVANILEKKLYLEIVPDNIRNSYYSLLPTVALILSAPLSYLAGYLVSTWGMVSAIVIFLILSTFSVVFTYHGLQKYTRGDHTIDTAPTYNPERIHTTSTYSSIVESNHGISIPKDISFTLKNHEIVETLLETSLDDGILSEEEKDLLSNIMVNLSEYSSTVESAHEDNILTEEEKQELIAFRKRIISNARTIVKQDDKISDDELQILNKLKELL